MTMTNQRVDEWGRVIFHEDGLLELLYKGLAQSPDLLAEDTSAIRMYNRNCVAFDAVNKQFEITKPLDVTPSEYHAARQREWLVPREYLQIDLDEFLYSRCRTEAQVERVQMELDLYRHYEIDDTLRLFIYITETLKNEGVWWGVGRGSSVASYCLYLIGVHRVDSLKYGLDIREFLKDS